MFLAVPDFDGPGVFEASTDAVWGDAVGGGQKQAILNLYKTLLLSFQ